MREIESEEEAGRRLSRACKVNSSLNRPNEREGRDDTVAKEMNKEVTLLIKRASDAAIGTNRADSVVINAVVEIVCIEKSSMNYPC